MIKSDTKPLRLAPMEAESNVEMNIQNIHLNQESMSDTLKQLIETVNKLAEINGL